MTQSLPFTVIAHCADDGHTTYESHSVLFWKLIEQHELALLRKDLQISILRAQRHLAMILGVVASSALLTGVLAAAILK